MIAVLVPACSYTTHVTTPQPSTLASAPFLPEAKQALVLDDVQVVHNGKADNVDPGFIQRFVLELRRTGLFREVYALSTHPELPPNVAHMRLALTETLDRHWGENVGKDVLVGLSYMTLAPVVSYQRDYAVSLSTTLTLPSGETHEFTYATQAQVDYKKFADVHAAEEELKQTALNDCVNGLLAKMKADAGFVRALARQPLYDAPPLAPVAPSSAVNLSPVPTGPAPAQGSNPVSSTHAQLRRAETEFRAGRMSLEEFRQIKKVLQQAP